MIAERVLPEQLHFVFGELYFNLRAAGCCRPWPAANASNSNECFAEFIVETKNCYRVAFKIAFNGSTFPRFEVCANGKIRNKTGCNGAM